MGKSIYEEALGIVTEALEQPDNSVVFKHTGLNELKKAIEKAQKQEELLALYKRVITEKDDMLSCCEVTDLDYYDIKEMVTRFEKRIKELENND